MKMQKSLSASEQLRQQYQQTLEQHLKRLKRSLESGPGQRFWLKWYQSLDEQPAERQQAARLSWAELVHLPLYL